MVHSHFERPSLHLYELCCNRKCVQSIGLGCYFQYAFVQRIYWYFNSSAAPWWRGFWKCLVGICFYRIKMKSLYSTVDTVDETFLSRNMKHKQNIIAVYKCRFRIEYLDQFDALFHKGTRNHVDKWFLEKSFSMVTKNTNVWTGHSDQLQN